MKLLQLENYDSNLRNNYRQGRWFYFKQFYDVTKSYDLRPRMELLNSAVKMSFEFGKNR